GELERAEVGSDATLAANRIMLVDPRGVIDEGDLLEFLEEEIEPRLWIWIAKKARTSRQGADAVGNEADRTEGKSDSNRGVLAMSVRVPYSTVRNLSGVRERPTFILQG